MEGSWHALLAHTFFVLCFRVKCSSRYWGTAVIGYIFSCFFLNLFKLLGLSFKTLWWTRDSQCCLIPPLGPFTLMVTRLNYRWFTEDHVLILSCGPHDCTSLKAPVLTPIAAPCMAGCFCQRHTRREVPKFRRNNSSSCIPRSTGKTPAGSLGSGWYWWSGREHAVGCMLLWPVAPSCVTGCFILLDLFLFFFLWQTDLTVSHLHPLPQV